MPLDANLNINLTGFPPGRLESLIQQAITQGEQILATIAELREQVNRNTAVTQSAITLIQGLAQKIEDLKDDPAELQALADELRGSADSLANAVSANTPSDEAEEIADILPGNRQP